jgi:hypothetical protein
MGRKEHELPAWTSKDRRQYEHVKASEIERGRREATAEEIAGRTVNKRRREEGRTPNRRTMGTGNPNAPLAELTRDELYNRARELGIPGRSRMTRTDLAGAVGRRGGG